MSHSPSGSKTFPSKESEVGPQDSVSNVGSSRSMRSNLSTMSSRSARAAKVAALRTKAQMMSKKHGLEIGQEAVRQRRAAEEQTLREQERALREQKEAVRRRREAEEADFRRQNEVHDVTAELAIAEAEDRAITEVESGNLQSAEEYPLPQLASLQICDSAVNAVNYRATTEQPIQPRSPPEVSGECTEDAVTRSSAEPFDPHWQQSDHQVGIHTSEAVYAQETNKRSKAPSTRCNIVEEVHRDNVGRTLAPQLVSNRRELVDPHRPDDERLAAISSQTRSQDACVVVKPNISFVDSEVSYKKPGPWHQQWLETEHNAKDEASTLVDLEPWGGARTEGCSVNSRLKASASTPHQPLRPKELVDPHRADDERMTTISTQTRPRDTYVVDMDDMGTPPAKQRCGEEQVIGPAYVPVQTPYGKYARPREQSPIEYRPRQLDHASRRLEAQVARRESMGFSISRSQSRRDEAEIGNQSSGQVAEPSLATLIGVLQAPKVTLMTFDGNPLEYHTFIRCVEDNIEKFIQDSASRLSRLIQQCTGEAERVIRCCRDMSPEIGYRRAKHLLKERFGDKYVISNLWVKQLTEENHLPLREYADSLRSCYEALVAMGAPNELNNGGALTKLLLKLPPYLQNRWKSHSYRARKEFGRVPTLLDVVTFIEDAAGEEADPLIGSISGYQEERTEAPGSASRVSGSKRRTSPQKCSFSITATVTETCAVCAQGHATGTCKKLAEMSVVDRRKTIFSRRLCFNCLKSGHRSSDCRYKGRCKASECGRKHHTILHDVNWVPQPHQEQAVRQHQSKDKEPTPAARGPPEESSLPQAQTLAAGESVSGSNHAASSHHSMGRKVALPIVAVKVKAPGSQRCVQTYALLDSGSTNSFCSQELLGKLGIDGRDEMVTMATLGNKSDRWKAKAASLEVISKDGGDALKLQSVYSRKNLAISTDNVATSEEVEAWPHLRGLPVLGATTEDVCLLIGQDCPEAIIPLQVVPGQAGEPYAVRTRLGWTITGPITAERGRGGKKHDSRDMQETEPYVGYCRLNPTYVSGSRRSNDPKELGKPSPGLTTQREGTPYVRSNQLPLGLTTRLEATNAGSKPVGPGTQHKDPSKPPSGLTHLSGAKTKQRSRRQAHYVASKQEQYLTRRRSNDAKEVVVKRATTQAAHEPSSVSNKVRERCWRSQPRRRPRGRRPEQLPRQMQRSIQESHARRERLPWSLRMGNQVEMGVQWPPSHARRHHDRNPRDVTVPSHASWRK